MNSIGGHRLSTSKLFELFVDCRRLPRHLSFQGAGYMTAGGEGIAEMAEMAEEAEEADLHGHG